MRINVTEQGLTIPKEFFDGVQSVEIRQEKGQIILIPTIEDDPIWGLGSDPISLDIPDAAENHDHYIYGSIS